IVRPAWCARLPPRVGALRDSRELRNQRRPCALGGGPSSSATGARSVHPDERLPGQASATTPTRAAAARLPAAAPASSACHPERACSSLGMTSSESAAGDRRDDLVL